MSTFLYQVRYTWRDERGARKEGRTVVTDRSQLEAEAKFQRQNPHVAVVPAVAVVMPSPVAQEAAS